MATETIPHYLFQTAKNTPDAPAYYVKADGRWKPASWAEYAAEVRRAARALIALGLEPGSTVSILGFNRPEWVIMDIATMAIGGAPVGIYTTSSPPEAQYIAHHAESKVVLVENANQWKKIEQELPHLPLVERVVLMKGAPPIDHPLVLSWEAFLEKGDAVEDERLSERLAALKPDGLATLIYTSGTTGPPKGVMLSHENLAWTSALGCQLYNIKPSDSCLSYLPLSHIAEQSFSIHGAIIGGISVYFAESIDKLADNLKEVEPTVFFGVPRIWEKFYAGIQEKLASAPKQRKLILEAARKVGARVSRERNEGKTPNALLMQAHKVADKAVFSKLKAALGLRRARLCMSGAAPVSREVLEFFASIDIVVYEAYGQSEDTGPTSYNIIGKARIGTVGTPLPGVAVKIAEDGEIVVKGPNVFLGYYKDPKATAETLVHGWMHSGDIGKFDEKGFLTITGRKKELLITAGGENVAPKNIEAAFKRHAPISEAVVIGDRRKYLTVLLTLDPDAAARMMKERGISGALHESPELNAQVQAIVDQVNRELARVQTIKKFRILPRPFGVDTGELTPTLKVKRNIVYKHFASEIESMYTE